MGSCTVFWIDRLPLAAVRRGLKAGVHCEPLEGRQLLSRGLNFPGGQWGRADFSAPRSVELSSFGGWRQNGMFGGGAFGLGGGMETHPCSLRLPLVQTASVHDTPFSGRDVVLVSTASIPDSSNGPQQRCSEELSPRTPRSEHFRMISRRFVKARSPAATPRRRSKPTRLPCS